MSIKQPKVYGISFRTEDGLNHCYINGIKQRFCTHNRSPVAHFPISYEIGNGIITFYYHVTNGDGVKQIKSTFTIIE